MAKGNGAHLKAPDGRKGARPQLRDAHLMHAQHAESFCRVHVLAKVNYIQKRGICGVAVRRDPRFHQNLRTKDSDA